MAATEIAVKKYVVKLSSEERDRLDTMIHVGKHSARQLMKARILLKADASEAGEGWSDSRIFSNGSVSAAERDLMSGRKIARRATSPSRS